MQNKLLQLEVLLVVIGILLAVQWALNPSLNAEPYLAVVATFAAGLELLRRVQLQRATPNVEESAPLSEVSRKSVSHAEPPERSVPNLYLPTGQGSRSLFAERFAHAFPGVREVAWFDSATALDRLLILLAEPLSYHPDEQKAPPFWWWRSGNLQIESFTRIDARTALMNWTELRIRRVAALPGHDYKWNSVYVECEAMPSVDLYEPLSAEERAEYLGLFGYLWEEFAIFKGHKIKRSEYDDGAAQIAGAVVRLHGEAEPRTRYISPYNFLIAPIASPINNNQFDQTLKNLMNGMLAGRVAIEQVSAAISALPLPARFQG